MRIDETGKPSAALCAALFNACFDGIGVARLDGRYVYVNRAFCELVGYERDELLQRTVHDLVPPTAEARLFPRVAAGMSGIRRADLLRKDGALVPVEISGSRVDTGGGELLILGIARDLRPVEEARRALREAEANLAAIFAATPDMYFLHAADGMLVDVNDNVLRAYRCTREEILTLPPETWIGAGRTFDQFADLVRRTLEGEPLDFDWVARREDGTELPVSVRLRRADGAGDVAVVAVVRDQTGQKRAERALRESEQRYRGLVENLPTAVLVHAGGVVQFANPAAVRLVGAESVDQLLGVPVIDLVSPEQWPAVQKRVRQVIEEGRPAPFVEERLRRLDGTTFDGEVAGVPVTFEGRPASQVILRDVSERKAHERALEKLNRTLRMISGCNQLLVRARSEPELVQGVCEIVCRAGGYRFAWVGWARDDPERTVEPVAHAGHEDGYLDRVKISWANHSLGRGPTGTAIRTGLCVVCGDTETDAGYGPWRKEAKRRDYGSSIALPLKLDGKASGALNIYAERQAAFDPEEVELLEELAADLAYGVGRLRLETRHRELEAELRQAQKLNALGTLVGGIAHDFNNHLTAIAGNLFLAIADAAGRPAVIERLHDVERSCCRSAELIKRLLTFARKEDVELVRLDLRSFLDENLKLLRATIPENIELRLDAPSESVWVRGDATQLQQILINLVVNARDAVQTVAAPAITVRLRVAEPGPVLREVHPDLARRRLAELAVEDNGCGIAESDREKAFEPFFTTKPAGHGTGLGLSTVYGAVQTHHGAVRLESEPGRGTRIRIDLPLEEAPPEPADSPSAKKTIGRGELILLADDNLPAGKVTRAILESFGFRVVYARDGEEAVAVALEHRAELRLALLDVVMPKLGGPEAARRIREQLPRLPVLLYSGYGAAHVPGRSAAGKGPLALLGKPVLPQELGRTVRRLLDEAG